MAFRNLPEMPCGPILEMHGQRKRFHVPYGLKRLIEDMTREVLRYQPSNIYEFLAVFMESRMQKRLTQEEKNQRRKSWQQHRWSWQGGSVLEPEDLKEFLEQLTAPAEEVNHHAIVIQSAFRGYQARKKVKEIRKSIQLDDGQRKSMLDSLAEGKKNQDENDNQEDGTGAPRERRNTMDLTPQNATEEEIHSAVVIQAAFRGMQSRKTVKKIRASIDEGGDRKSDTQKRYSTEDVQDQKQGSTDKDQAEGMESNATMANGQESDAGMNKENETGISTENQNDTGTVVEGQPREVSSNANASQQQQETSNQPTEENAPSGAPSTAAQDNAQSATTEEGQGQTEAEKTDEGQKTEETKPE